jgi:protoheme IX farnesyltransferase
VSQVIAVETRGRSLARDLVTLTKPRIISLLLVTTIAPMFVAGSPSWSLVLAVFVGGYLMAGGANAVNMYMDRDIDDRMSRTRLRPIPSGRMQPREVLAFGVLLSTTATWLLAQAANVLTAALALAGFYFYVFVYTRWLKRSTPQNIVIGGAAGESICSRSIFFSSSSTGRRRISGRSRCSSRKTTAAPAFPWRRWSGANARRNARCCGTP